MLSDMPMTSDECKRIMQSFEPRIAAYADLIVRRGVAIQDGQELAVTAPVEAADFVRVLVEKAYDAGAGHVTLAWTDSICDRFEFERCPVKFFEKCPAWFIEKMNGLAKQGAAFLSLIGEDPDGFKNIDPVKIATRHRAVEEQCTEFRHGIDFGLNTWSVSGVPCPAWAKKVFPDASPEEAKVRLWDAVLTAARVCDENPLDAWAVHDASFEHNCRILNEHHFDMLHYKAGNGTDITIGMTDKHIWQGGSAKTTQGILYFPNIPTEEVFTTPDRLRVDGIVYATMPLSWSGCMVRDFWLRFKDGKVVDYGAAEGLEALKSVIETDERSSYLGEVALIAKDVPIRESGLLFFNTLYDENASCHLALGTGFPECYEGGLALSDEELVEAGVNRSHAHLDFMIGADDLNITGITSKREEVPVFCNGRWAWE